jgi:hypothetical protein
MLLFKKMLLQCKGGSVASSTTGTGSAQLTPARDRAP